MKKFNISYILILILFSACSPEPESEQAVSSLNQNEENNFVSAVWQADQGDGTYKNPILYADYSDPDVCRVGDDFYMTASSFNCVPGLPILHSRDLVNWRLIGHAIDTLKPYENFMQPQHGNGIWAPSIRYHNNEVYIYWGDPDYGIYMVKTSDPTGDWEEPVLVQEGKGLIDPSPLWDDDGNAYLVHAFAGSRSGVKSILVVNRMSPDGTKLLDEGTIVFDGHANHPTVEGPKFYKRNGYYYIFAPAGGVPTGWQLILRSKNIYGPYEEKIVLEQGSTEINGPHQGGWVELNSGESWFIHFQDREAYGRIVHLQPVNWVDDWPLMGEDLDGNGVGEPVASYTKPKVNGSHPLVTPPDSDEFDQPQLGLQWQWHANPELTWAFPTANGHLRMYARDFPEDAVSLWQVPQLLLQKIPAPEFSATTRFSFIPKEDGDEFGLVIMGEDYGYLSVVQNGTSRELRLKKCTDARQGNAEQEMARVPVEDGDLWFRVEMEPESRYHFSYSTDGNQFNAIGDTYQARPGRWIGAKVGFFSRRANRTNDSGYTDIDWIRFEKPN